MRPWWLRPPADDDADSGEKAPAESSEQEAPAADEAPVGASADDDGGAEAADPVEPKEEPAATPEESSAAEQRAEKASGNGGRRKRSKRRSDPPKVEILDPIDHEIVLAEPVLADTGGSTVNNQHERRIALFCDLENVALGVRDSDIKKFELNLVLERLLEKGKIIVKKAYCDWERYNEFKRPFHEAAVEMIDIPQKYYSGKNSADIKMAVDALELCYSKEHVDTFAILSGDSDFSPLVSKLREANKLVIGVGVKNSSSALLVDNCDEFLFYEDIWRDNQKAPQVAGRNKKQGEAFSLMVDSIKALMREDKDVLWGSMVKQTMKRKRPSFNEGYHGYSSFSELLEDAERNNIVRLKRDQRSGSYIITGFAAIGPILTERGRAFERGPARTRITGHASDEP